MPDSMDIRTLRRKNVKSLILDPGLKVENVPRLEVVKQSDTSYLKDALDNLEVIIEFKLDLMPEDFELKDLITFKQLPDDMSGEVSLAKHGPSGVVMAKRTIGVSPIKLSGRRAIQRELQMMRDCSSPFLVECFGTFVTDDHAVICMEYMDLGSLANISRRHGPIQIDVLGKIAEAILGGITYLYSNFKIMHRNLKPSKVLLNSLGQIKLSDFRASGELLNSVAETVVGSGICYMAPERIQGDKYTIKAETWSFGLMIMELAIGKFPYDFELELDDEGESVNILDVLRTIVHGPAPKLPTSDAFPSILYHMVETCVQKDPNDRPRPLDLYEKDNFIQAGKRTSVNLTAWISGLYMQGS